MTESRFRYANGRVACLYVVCVSTKREASARLPPFYFVYYAAVISPTVAGAGGQL